MGKLINDVMRLKRALKAELEREHPGASPDVCVPIMDREIAIVEAIRGLDVFIVANEERRRAW